MTGSGKFSIYNDEELMRFVCEGKTAAFDELYARYCSRLMNYFMRMLNNDKALAEDALQDVFLKIAESPQRFDRTRSFKTWVFSVASNSCKNYYRHQKVVRESHSEIAFIEKGVDERNFLKAAGRMDAARFRRMLEEVLDTLAPEKKEAFILKYQEDKSLKEIAEIQNCPEGSVKSRLHYAVKVLEEKLKIFDPLN